MTLTIDRQNLEASEFNDSIQEPLRQICEPLFKYFPVKNFSYQRFFLDGTHLSICTHKEWNRFYLCERNIESPAFWKEIRARQSDGIFACLWPQSTEDPILGSLYEFGIWNGLSFYQNHPEYLEVWAFSGSRESDQDLLNFYINKKEALLIFIRHFNAISPEFINFEQTRYRAQFKTRLIDPQITFSDVDDFTKEFMEKLKGVESKSKLYLQVNNKPIGLSRRERECLEYLSQGKTMKEIARFLDLSPRTVEYYLNIIKQKTGVHTKGGLLNLYLKNSIS
jgi:DNA-binding CsgD family transcriptional regulator